jgi:hypothetical protein
VEYSSDDLAHGLRHHAIADYLDQVFPCMSEEACHMSKETYDVSKETYHI